MKVLGRLFHDDNSPTGQVPDALVEFRFCFCYADLEVTFGLALMIVAGILLHEPQMKTAGDRIRRTKLDALEPLGVINSVGMKLVVYGLDPAFFRLEFPRHRIDLTSFYIAAHEITLGQFEQQLRSPSPSTTAARSKCSAEP